MFLTDYLIKRMQNNNIIGEDTDIYIYGLNNGFALFINISTAILISFIIDKQDILPFLLISFIPLRSYCGGFHLKSRFKCYICSNIILTVLLLMQNIFCENLIEFLIISSITFIYLFCSKTKSTQVRLLDYDEIFYFTKIKRIILTVIIVVSIVLIITKNYIYATCMMTSINFAFFLVILDSAKNIIQSYGNCRFSIK